VAQSVLRNRSFLSMSITISPWLLLALVPVVLAVGRFLCQRVLAFARFNLPVPVVGGLLFALVLTTLNATEFFDLTVVTRVSAGWWTWMTLPEPEWSNRPAQGVNFPFLVAFFTCIGLNATWSIVRQGSWQLALFWGLASVLAVGQNLIGLLGAALLGQDPLLGLMCGSVSMTGGHGTALGFAAEFEQAGLAGAGVIGAAAATFGLVAGGIIGSPVATALIRRRGLRAASVIDVERPSEAGQGPGFLAAMRRLGRSGWSLATHLLLLALIIKAGAWVTYGMKGLGLVFPAYMGALLVGVVVRNLTDLAGWRLIDSRVVDDLAMLALGVFLATAMASLRLSDLAQAALPMLAILFVQTAVVAVFAWWVTFRLMGRDYDAAVMAGGHCGFGLGATPTAVANMEAITEKLGPAYRAFIIVPPVGAALIDLTNSFSITFFLNLIR
jgi:glutamate:Na+ symporter, ESS family